MTPHHDEGTGHRPVPSFAFGGWEHTRWSSRWPHLAAASWIAGVLLLARLAPSAYDRLMQEDHAIEWWTVSLFAAAAVLRLRAAVRGRRPVDLLVALFCLVVAGEEMSWGQRLVGFAPPAAFLEHNAQQELTLHNFADVLGQPKWVLAAALVGYGVLLPLAARAAAGTRALVRLGASAPPLPAAPWFAAAAALLAWYPVDFTGEWVELLAGALFLATAPVATTSVLAGAGGGLLLALAATGLVARRAADPRLVACALAEADALLIDLAQHGAATSELAGAAHVHKRLWSMDRSGYVRLPSATAFATARCDGEAGRNAAERRRFGLDPWNQPYWIFAERVADGRRVVVYSFGPNRRRDRNLFEAPGASSGDDVVSEGLFPVDEAADLPDAGAGEVVGVVADDLSGIAQPLRARSAGAVEAGDVGGRRLR